MTIEKNHIPDPVGPTSNTLLFSNTVVSSMSSNIRDSGDERLDAIGLIIPSALVVLVVVVSFSSAADVLVVVVVVDPTPSVDETPEPFTNPSFVQLRLRGAAM